MSTFQLKFDHINLSSHSWDISKQRFYSYWWPDISVVCCHFCTSHKCTYSPHLGLYSTTQFVKIGPLVVKIQAEWSLWQFLLWQLLDTKSNDYTSGKSLSIDIKWEVHKRTRQGVSAKLESYIYKIHMVHATNNYAYPYVHATTSFPTQGYYIVYMCPDVIF